MKIDNNILAISKCMFQLRNNWIYVTNEQKKEFFFIFNRYFSKKYPEQSHLLNYKGQDEVLGMNLWYEFMKNKPYPDWFWSKKSKEKSDSIFTEKELNLLMSKFDIKFEELDLLLTYHIDDIKEELKWIKDNQKNT